MHIPTKIEPTCIANYLETMAKSMFQSGISWRVVDSKWPSMRIALQGFDVRAIANLSEPELDILVQDERIIRSRRKLDALVVNANKMMTLDAQHGSFTSYLRSHGSFESTLKDIRKQFKYMGDSGTYHFLCTVGEDVPPYEVWCISH